MCGSVSEIPLSHVTYSTSTYFPLTCALNNCVEYRYHVEFIVVQRLSTMQLLLCLQRAIGEDSLDIYQWEPPLVLFLYKMFMSVMASVCFDAFKFMFSSRQASAKIMISLLFGFRQRRLLHVCHISSSVKKIRACEIQ